MKSDVGFTMNQDEIKYLDTMKKDLMAATKDSENHIKDYIGVRIDNLNKEVDRHTGDISELYEADRAINKTIAAMENKSNEGDQTMSIRLTQLEKCRDERKDSKAWGLSIISAVIAIAGVIAGVVALFFNP